MPISRLYPCFSILKIYSQNSGQTQCGKEWEGKEITDQHLQREVKNTKMAAECWICDTALLLGTPEAGTYVSDAYHRGKLYGEMQVNKCFAVFFKMVL